MQATIVRACLCSGLAGTSRHLGPVFGGLCGGGGQPLLALLEDTARYAVLLPAPAEGFNLRPWLILPFGEKREPMMLFWPIFCNFWVSSSNLGNFQ